LKPVLSPIYHTHLGRIIDGDRRRRKEGRGEMRDKKIGERVRGR